MKTQTTITEALQELKTIDKRIQSTNDFVTKYAIRQGTVIDPLDDEGGSHKVIPEKLQSIKDLWTRKLDIRSAINKANQSTTLSIGGMEMSVAEWIIWRREVQKSQLSVYRSLQARVLDMRRQCVEKGMTVKEGEQPTKVQEVGCFISESDIQSKIEFLEETESVLDGKLSLVNATTTISI